MAGDDRQPPRSPLASGIVGSPARQPSRWREAEGGLAESRTLPPPRPSPGSVAGRSPADGDTKPVLPKLSSLLAETEGSFGDVRTGKQPMRRPAPERYAEWLRTPSAGPSSFSSSPALDRRPSSTTGFYRSSPSLDRSGGSTAATDEGRLAEAQHAREAVAAAAWRDQARSFAAPAPASTPPYPSSSSFSAAVDPAGPSSRSRYHPYFHPSEARERGAHAREPSTSFAQRLSPSPSQPSRQWVYVVPPSTLTATPADLPPRPVVWPGGAEHRSHPGSSYRAQLLPDPVLHGPLAPTAPPPTLASVLMPEEGEPRTFELIIRQQPMSGRMCGFGSKDFRPLDLLPIIELRIRDKDGNLDEAATSSPNLVVQASLLLGDEEIVAALTSNPHATNFPTTRLLEGGVIASGHVAKDLDGSRACFFPFISLCVRLEGVFRLKFSLVKLGAPSWSPAASPESVAGTVLTSVVSQPFEVFSARKFPGVRESTALAKSLANQGIQVPIRNKRRAD